MVWEIIGYVKASNYRKSILTSLRENNMTPKELSEKLKIPISHISNTLRDLTTKGLVICLTPTLRKGRIYSLTSLGRTVIARITDRDD